MAGFTVNIKGLKELDAKLGEMKLATQKSIVRDSLMAGAEVIRTEIAARAPVRDYALSPRERGGPQGALKLDIEKRFVYLDGLPSVLVAPGKATAWYAKWVEYGHRLVRGGYSSMKRGKLQGRGHQVGSVEAHAFIRPGYETAREEAVQVAARRFGEDVEKAAAKR